MTGSKPTCKTELKLTMCQKRSARDRNLQSAAHTLGIKLTVHSPLEGGLVWSSRPGADLGPQILSRMRVFSPDLTTQPCNSGGSLPLTTSWTPAGLRQGQWEKALPAACWTGLHSRFLPILNRSRTGWKRQEQNAASTHLGDHYHFHLSWAEVQPTSPEPAGLFYDPEQVIWDFRLKRTSGHHKHSEDESGW